MWFLSDGGWVTGRLHGANVGVPGKMLEWLKTKHSPGKKKNQVEILKKKKVLIVKNMNELLAR